MIGYFLFLLVNATLFVRPADLFPQIADWPIYQCLIIAAVLASLPQIWNLFARHSLTEQPTTLCILAVLAAIVLSHLVTGFLWGARMSGFEYSKIVVYYVLLVAHCTTTQRLRNFMLWLAFFIVVLALLPLLHNYHIINVPALDSLEQFEVVNQWTMELSVMRIQSTGIFNDPNDLGMILIVGIMLCTYFLLDWPWWRAPLWLIPLGLCLYVFAMTKSRGATLALAAAAVAAMYHYWGWKRSILAAIPVVVLAVAVFQQRADAMTEGTGQSRVQLWSEALTTFKGAPFFGIGQGMYDADGDQVPHNSFLHAFAELGFAGGMFFLGAFLGPLLTLRRARKSECDIDDPDARRLRAAIAGIIVGTATAMMSLSRAYVVSPYVALGLAVAWQLRDGAELPKRERIRFDLRFAGALPVTAVAMLAMSYTFIRTFVRW